ncbi:hypothetical protein [Streptomyces johnsoniae]|uniref:hypothetical protein n=1 Tax=Streptomyces johnsoniae TaxID=3075532 RepID=UPI00288C089B|nr:hypothetical protein [Streptomyces sp. DSM 41886]
MHPKNLTLQLQERIDFCLSGRAQSWQALFGQGYEPAQLRQLFGGGFHLTLPRASLGEEPFLPCELPDQGSHGTLNVSVSVTLAETAPMRLTGR